MGKWTGAAMISRLLAVLPFCMLLAQAPYSASQRIAPITPGEVADMLHDKYECGNQTVSVAHFEYHNFTGQGHNQLVLVASTCMTGTAGPDIHAVYSRNSKAQIVELPIEPSRKKLPLFGNRNFVLTVENGLLLAQFTDSSDRDNPATIRYRWNGKQFAVASVKITGPFKTSYNCAVAKKEVEQAICYSPSLAALDLQLDKAYRLRLNALPSEQRNTLQQKQRKWLSERESKCAIYKWWVDCLSDLYKKKIVELEK